MQAHDLLSQRGRMEQREPETTSDSGEILPHAAAFAREAGVATVTIEAPGTRVPSRGGVVVIDDDDPRGKDDDDDESARDDEGDDDAPPARPARVDPRLLDPDVIKRARRVEIYRRLIEQDPSVSLFSRPDSPPRRDVPAPKGLCG